jgi:hypothetical protein
VVEFLVRMSEFMLHVQKELAFGTKVGKTVLMREREIPRG